MSLHKLVIPYWTKDCRLIEPIQDTDQVTLIELQWEPANKPTLRLRYSMVTGLTYRHKVDDAVIFFLGLHLFLWRVSLTTV